MNALMNKLFGNDYLQYHDDEQLVCFFKTSPHDPQHVTASLDGINVDFKYLLTLVGERYIDNFVINFCLKKAIL